MNSAGLAAIELLTFGAAGDPFSWSSLEVSGHLPLHGSSEAAFQAALDVLFAAGLLASVADDAVAYDNAQELELSGPWYRINQDGLRLASAWTRLLQSGDAAGDVDVADDAPHALRILGLLQQGPRTERQLSEGLGLGSEVHSLLQRIGARLAIQEELGLVERIEDSDTWQLTQLGAQHLLLMALRSAEQL